jgi:hypothetical protein
MNDDLELKGRERAPKQLTSFLAFWYASAAVLLVVGIAAFAAIHNGHRLAAFFLLLGVCCLGAALVVQRARRAQG